MEIIFKNATEMTPSELRAAKKLTLPDGMMWDTLLDSRDRNSFTIGDVGLVYEGTRLVCWALAWKDKYHYENNRTVYFYTHPKYRRMGYGTMIFKKMKQRYKSFHVSPWDRNSAGFFNQQKINENSRRVVTAILNGAWDD